MRQRVAHLALGVLVAMLTGAALPTVVGACSCVQFEGFQRYVGDPAHHVFSGTVVDSGARGVVVAVDRWFQGSGEPIVRLGGEFGGQSAACELQPPPIGSRWLYAAYLPESGGLPRVNLCTPQAPLDGAPDGEGAGLEAQAIVAFGGGRPPPTELPVPPPASLDPATTGPAAMAAIAVAMTAAIVALFGAVVIAARRRAR